MAEGLPTQIQIQIGLLMILGVSWSGHPDPKKDPLSRAVHARRRHLCVHEMKWATVLIKVNPVAMAVPSCSEDKIFCITLSLALHDFPL